jgi:hypothetical protein
MPEKRVAEQHRRISENSEEGGSAPQKAPAREYKHPREAKSVQELDQGSVQK